MALAPDVVRVRLEHLDLVHRVVVVDADQHVVRASDDPLLASHELGRPHWQLAHLERLDESLLRERGERDGSEHRACSDALDDHPRCLRCSRCRCCRCKGSRAACGGRGVIPRSGLRSDQDAPLLTMARSGADRRP